MQNIKHKDIEGLWNLLSMEQRYDDGRVIYPFGRNVEGRIYYGADKSMFCAIQKSGRTPFSTGKQWTADEAEKAGAYNDYLTYCGRYELDGDTATHHIEISLYPDWIGKQQARKIRLVDGLLHITARLEDNTPEARTSLMIWERAGSGY